jgi:hypothetical protein
MLQMRTICFVLAASCLVFQSAHANSAYPLAYQKSQAESRYLSAFWHAAQIDQAFVRAFYDATPKLVMGLSADATRLENFQNAKNTHHDAGQTAVMESPERPSMPANPGS